eukprot:NODE_1131_length_599_cov_48.061818_g1057_i0.p1 GENE.NODE_1131_length_599_cov_48.061818_g1057_i0~~NODE_1131_length_599_cov_48.061818_g1057_i0.p1  ORF type:complete len:76 (+),score=13.36 NODE_1131_length_599_cov_48.061818_g1057_i0:88-315(+)
MGLPAVPQPERMYPKSKKKPELRRILGKKGTRMKAIFDAWKPENDAQEAHGHKATKLIPKYSHLSEPLVPAEDFL